MQRRRPNPLDQPPSPLQQDVADLESPLHADDDGKGKRGFFARPMPVRRGSSAAWEDASSGASRRGSSSPRWATPSSSASRARSKSATQGPIV